MNYDVIVIGGGLSGLTSAIHCAEAGLKTVVISAGESSLAFASGCIDVLGFNQNNQAVEFPFEEIALLPAEHPYKRIGSRSLKQGLSFFLEQMALEDIAMAHNEQKNHGRLTALGAVRPTWLSQAGTKHLPINKPLDAIKKIAVANIAGFRDFQPELVIAGMKRNPMFANNEFNWADISPETLGIAVRNPYELRSLELARTLKRDLFNKPNGMNIFASALQKAARNADLVLIPSVLAVELGNDLIAELEQLTGLSICEVASLPPSLPGMRLASALKARFRKFGGILLEGDDVISGRFSDKHLQTITTRLSPNTPLSAKHFVLATGSFFSKGLSSNRSELTESVFNLSVNSETTREQWSNDRFIDGQHSFTTTGIRTDNLLNPYREDEIISNLYCAGAVLSGFNPVREASAGGVAIATGWFAASQIIAKQSAV
ncbi:glycerol-3-phosphate dehydrogenase subunit GlpB [uncultured Endozoicomonas sp.]|uniref:glycerol-3-phosphate dehydrogenase subunit GlpB n=1 Tax=uncultured Endozoicomonas sp. TaxID=432652 RepID=UPI0026157C97|nr:glycerol-3-phosphate dehydrogenase subunit GlpB [uncultured Endozoicomonas sp.]